MTSWRDAILLGVVLASLPGAAAASSAAPQPAVLTVYAAGRATTTSLHLQPGFATILRADHRIETVAIGDPRLVTATAVKRGQDVYDLIIQPQAEAGTTNMVVWFGQITTIWDLEIGPGVRTADIVYVVTAPPATAPRPGTRPAAIGPAQPAPPAATGPAQPAAPAAAGREPAEAPEQPGPTAVTALQGSSVGTASGAASPPLLEVRQTMGDVVAVFEAVRAPDGVLIRYRITNGGDTDLTIRPAGVLVRVNGRFVPYAMARASVDRSRPELLPKGATETGVIDAPASAARSVQVILSLFPISTDDEPAGVALPLTFEPTFAGVDRLAISSDP